MVQQKLALTLSLLSSLSLCQASSFVYDDFLAYPRYKLELTEKRIPESSVFGQQQSRDKQIGWWNSQDQHDSDPNKVIMLSANAQPFLCTIPDATTEQKKHSSANTKSDASSLQETQHTIERGLKLLKPLENKCLYFYTHGYWTYEYCHMQHVRQFHLEDSKSENNNKLIVDEKASFILGKARQQDMTNNDGSVDNTGDNTPSSPTATFDDNNSIRPRTAITTTTTTTSSSSFSSVTLEHAGDNQALVYHWGEGTPCDITNQPRSVDIQFQCSQQDKDQIVFFEETSTCHYRITIATPRLCDDLTLGTKKESQSHTIECHPIVPEYWITDHEQQEHQNDDTDQKETTEPENGNIQQQQQDGDDDDSTLVADTDSKEETSAPLAMMAKSELVGVISDLTKQVEQLKKSIELQYSMDQQQLQQNQVIYMDQNGQLIFGSVDRGTTLNNEAPPSNNDAAHILLKQFLLGGSSTPPPPPSQQQQQQQQQVPRPMDEPDVQQQNKKAYEKNYYSLD